MTADPRSPTPPVRPGAFFRWLWLLGRDVFDEYSDDSVGDLAAAITFWTILSIPAAILALVSALSSLDSVIGSSLAADIEDAAQDFIADTFVESDTLAGVVDELFNTSSTGLATVATVVAVFTLSRAFAGLIRALDIAYEVEDGRPFWYVRVVAIGLGVATIVVVTSTALFVAFLPSMTFIPGGRLIGLFAAFVVLVAWAATVFHIGPNHSTPWRYDVPGGIFTAIGWLVTTQLFALYVRFAGDANQVQSSIGVVLLALTLMYLLSVVLLLGAEVNDIIARRSDVVTVVAPVTDRARDVTRRLKAAIDDVPGSSPSADDGVTGTDEVESPK